MRLFATGVFLVGLIFVPRASSEVAPQAKEPTIEVLDRGPVHEAFAQPNAADPVLPPAVEKA